METVDNVLTHYGTKGMKWGIRKRRSKGGTPPEHQSEMAKKKHEIQDKIKKHGIDAATNEDLQLLERRVKLETKYNELFPKKPSVGKRLAKFGGEEAKKILLPIGEQQAREFLTKQLVKNMAPSKGSSAATSILKNVGDTQVKSKQKIGFV